MLVTSIFEKQQADIHIWLQLQKLLGNQLKIIISENASIKIKIKNSN